MPAKRKPSKRAATNPRRAPQRRAAPKRATGRATVKRTAPRRTVAKRATGRATVKRTAPRRTAAEPARAARQARASRPKAASRKRAAERAAPRRPSSRRTTPERKRPPVEAPPPSFVAEAEPMEAWPDEPVLRGPMIRGETVASAGEAVAAPPPPTPAWGEETRAPEPDGAKDIYREDIPIGVVAAALAGSVFLPWYAWESADLSISAWSSGTWGPIMFFLSIGSLLMIVLRRAGVRLSLPFEEALLHEFVGWVALAGGVIKSRFRPGPEGALGLSWGLWVGLGAAFLLAYLAGRMSPHAPMVRRPRWYRAAGGTLAALLLSGVVAGAAVFASINKVSLSLGTSGDGKVPGLVEGELPRCAGDFPYPSIVKPLQGYEGQACQAHLQSERPPAEVVAAMKTTLEQAGWTVRTGQTTGASALTLTAPKCATVVIVGADGGSLAIVQFGYCTPITPSPSPEATSS